MAGVARRRPRSWRAGTVGGEWWPSRRCRPTVPAGVGDQAPHRDGRAGGNRGRGHRARPARRPRRVHGAAPPRPRVRSRHRRRGRRPSGRRRIYSNAGSTRSPTWWRATESVRRLSGRGRPAPARDGRHEPGRLAGPRRRRPHATWPLWRASSRPDAARPGHAAPRHLGRLPGPHRGASGLRPQSPNDWGLGFEIRGTKSPHWTAPTNSPSTVGHFGQNGTFLWVDPAPGPGARLPHRPRLRSLGHVGMAGARRGGTRRLHVTSIDRNRIT